MKKAEPEVEDWSQLIHGDEVWLCKGGDLHASGWIDESMPDGSIVWINQHEALGRAMFLREEITHIHFGGDTTCDSEEYLWAKGLP